MIVFILHIFGLWHNAKSSTSLKLYKFYSYAIHFIFSLMYLICMIINFVSIKSINNATDALFPTLTVVAYCLKLVNFYFNADGMQKIFEDTMKFQFKNDNEIRLTNEKLRSLYKLSVCFMTTAHVTIILAFIRVLFINNPPELPLPCWYPIDWKNNSFYYWIAYTYQMIGAFLILNVNATLDLYSILLMAIISKHMEILGDRLANITLQYDKRTYKSTDPHTAEQARINEELIDCIEVHQNLQR